MELDVHLVREAEEPWGFEFVGGADYGIPLTIDKVFPSSPAHHAGLQPGDIVARLGDRLATELSQEAAVAIVAEAVGSLSFGIYRGLYDPVLDDYEPIYESIERADSDLRSEPTEVPCPLQCDPNELSLDDPRILDPNITDPSLFDSGYMTRPLTETRSLTESPFVPNSKPYRPFSTEPLEVPLEDPIILNANFKDTFDKFKDENGNVVLDPEEEALLRLIPLDKNVEAKFKLPISEKYDPDYEKKVRALLEKCVEKEKKEAGIDDCELAYYSGIATSNEVKVEAGEVNIKVSDVVNIQDFQTGQEITKEEVKFDQKTKQGIDIKDIQQTALEVVEESIERAVSVTEEIQKEIEEERASMTRESQLKKTEATSEIKTHTEESKSKIESKESVTEYEFKESVQRESDTIKNVKQERMVDSEEIIDEKLVKDQQFIEERTTKLTNKSEVEDTVETENVKRKTSVFSKPDELSTMTTDSVGNVKTQSVESVNEEEVPMKTEVTGKVSHAESKTEHVKKIQSSVKSEAMQSDGKQKAFMLGLQTIPHIKGFVQSSYHFDLLLRTFFVHLTDVMVALSRFIITQPTAERESKAEEVIKEKLTKEFTTKDSQQYERKEQHSHEERKQSVQETKQERLQERSHKEIGRKEKIVLKQETNQTSKDIKEVINESQKLQQIKKDIKQMEDIKAQQEVLIQDRISKKQEELEASFEDADIKKKSGSEMAQRTQRKSKDLTQKMNAVISEFETKTGIEDRLEVTEQRSRRSRSRSQLEEEVMRESDPLEWLDKVDNKRASQERTDTTTVKNEFSSISETKKSMKSESKLESRTTKVKPEKQMYVAIVESHVYTNKDAILEEQTAEMSETASIQSSEETNTALESLEAMSMENVAMSSVVTEEKQQAVEVITNALQEVVQETQEVLEAVKDLKSSQFEEEHSKAVIQESNASVAAEMIEVVSEARVETLKVKELKETTAAVVKEESYKTSAVEFVDIPLETIEEAKIVPKESKQAVVSTEENYKTTAQSTTQITLEESTAEKMELNANKQKAVATVESLAIAVAESTDTMDDSKVESFESKKVVSKIAKVAAEQTFKMAAVGFEEMVSEEAVEQHSQVTETSKATIREETQALAVAGIIETKAELCKEPKKPDEDEYAALKIVKEQIIDDGGVEIVEVLSESELNVNKSSEVEISSSQHATSVSQESYQKISQVTSSLAQASYQASSTVAASFQASSSVLETHQTASESSKLHLRTDLALPCQPSSQSDENNNTPSPSTVPPTPLTDEYVFKLVIPMPKNQGTVLVEESPDKEDPHIVKKGLVPHIETTIEEQIIYDPPLPTPPGDKLQSPVYTKPGLRGGGTLLKKEYIREIERKSSLLASAIDETIKSIEVYKEEVGIESQKDIKARKTEKHVTIVEKNGDTKITNGITNGLTNGQADKENAMKKEWDKVEAQVEESNVSLKELARRKFRAKEEESEPRATEKEDVDPIEENNELIELPGFKPVVFNPETYQAQLYEEVIRDTFDIAPKVKMYVNESGEPLGTAQGIVDGLEEAVVDGELAKELGKPGLTDDKIAVLISGESEMLREAHVMGLSRVLTSHMNRPDDSSVDFQKIKPLVASLNDSEVLKALNDELRREKSVEKKKEEKKWTTFLQKPKRPVPRAKFGYPGNVEAEEEEIVEESYKVKIVKQPKPKVAPDYKTEDFDTGPLPWEQRALLEPEPSPESPEEPILVPEETPEFLEAVDPMPESEVPDLEDTGIPLPPTPPPELPVLEEPSLPPLPEAQEAPPQPEPVEEPTMQGEDQNKMAEQLVNSVRSMVDPSASLELQLAQMRAQLAALAQLPCVIQQSLEMLTRQLSAMSQQESQQTSYESEMKMESHQEVQENTMTTIQEYHEEAVQNPQEVQNEREEQTTTIEEVQSPVETKPALTAEEYAAMKREEEAMIEEQRRSEKEKKAQQEKRIEQESRQVKQRAPRVGKPKPVFGPLSPLERPLVLPGGRRWRGPKDAYNEQMIAETLQSQAEIIQGKVMGYESDLLPYDDRINFMKYEKPPVNLDHLQNSATYKMVHNMETEPLRRVHMLTPVVAEADYRERCSSVTPMQTNGQM